MTDVRRGLGRGLQALLGEPVAADLGRGISPAGAPSGGAWIPPVAPVAPVSANVVELPTQASSAAFALGTGAAPFQTPPAPSQSPASGGDAGEAGGGHRLISLEAIQPNPRQPRRTFCDIELGELADSIRARGVLQPILVRPAPGQAGRFEIVAGERRYRAAQRAGLVSIPAVIRDLEEAEVLEIAIIENVQRVDLNPLEEAMGYQALIERFSRTQAEIAEIVGKSRPHIANMLRLLALPEEIQGLVREGRLTAGHARAMLTAPDPLGLARAALSQGLSVREVERLAARAKDERDGPRVTSSSSSDKDGDVVALEQSLSRALGLSVSISRKGDGAGEVRIAFAQLSQLDEINRRLSGAAHF